MPIAYAFWGVMFVWFLVGFYRWWPETPGRAAFLPLGAHVLAFIACALLGWQVFGSAIK